jgi:glycosyltransferase involved in cell wall biosynthesis
MNICYLIPFFAPRAGTESYVHRMSIALARLGHRVHIVSLTGAGQRDFEGLEGRIFVHQLRPLRRILPLDDLFPLFTWRYGRLVRRSLPAIIREQAVDIVEATDWGMDAWDYLPERQVPVCVRLHGYPGFKAEFDSGTLKRWPKNRISWSIQRKHILAADLVTGASRAYAELVREALEIREKKIQVIPIAIDPRVFRPGDTARQEQRVLFVGRLEESKGIDVLARAIPLVLAQMPKAQFYFAGADHRRTGSDQTWSRALIGQFGNEHVVYLGSLSTSELVRHYQTSTACVIPSLYEPGATVAFEAMACGCPVIASRTGGLVEVIQHGRTGLLTPPGDAVALADGLVELLQKEPWRRELSSEALASVRGQFDIDRIAQQTADAYAKTVAVFKASRGAGMPRGREVAET